VVCFCEGKDGERYFRPPSGSTSKSAGDAYGGLSRASDLPPPGRLGWETGVYTDTRFARWGITTSFRYWFLFVPRWVIAAVAAVLPTTWLVRRRQPCGASPPAEDRHLAGLAAVAVDDPILADPEPQVFPPLLDVVPVRGLGRHDFNGQVGHPQLPETFLGRRRSLVDGHVGVPQIELLQAHSPAVIGRTD
jgi:hypothetical protein